MRNKSVFQLYYSTLILHFCINIFLHRLGAAFELLPYVQIDYSHYARLAQCQAKCANAYGVIGNRRLLDGSFRRYQNISTETYELCETGCILHSRGSGAAARASSAQQISANIDADLYGALQNGENYWFESFAQSLSANATQQQESLWHDNSAVSSRTVIERIRVLCVEQQRPPPHITSLSSNSAYNFAFGAQRQSVASPAGLSSDSELHFRTPTRRSVGERRSPSIIAAAAAHHIFNAYDALLTADIAEMNGEEPRTRKFENKRRGGRGGGSKSRRNADLTEVERERAAMRFIVLWRQKAKLSIGEILDRRTTTTMPLQTANATEEMLATPSFSPTSKEDERATSWITGSIEAENTFKVEGIQADTLYRFMLVPISVGGRLGEPVKTDWIDFAQMLRNRKPESAALSFASHYNAGDGVGAIMRWVGAGEILPAAHFAASAHLNSTPPMVRQRSDDGQWQRPLLFEGCELRVVYANETTKSVEVFTVDDSDGYTLRTLGFASEYTVELTSKYSDASSSSEANSPSASIGGRFVSMSCTQIYGVGSLECDPEPVHNVRIFVHPENGTITVEWLPTAEPHFTLLYQLYYVPVSRSAHCALEPTSVFLTANSTRASLQMPSAAECEFELRVINYDLLGREAMATQRFRFGAATASRNAWERVVVNGELRRALVRHLPVIALIGVAVAVILFAVVLSASRSRSKWRKINAASVTSSSAGSTAKRDEKVANASPSRSATLISETTEDDDEDDNEVEQRMNASKRRLVAVTVDEYGPEEPELARDPPPAIPTQGSGVGIGGGDRRYYHYLHQQQHHQQQQYGMQQQNNSGYPANGIFDL